MKKSLATRKSCLACKPSIGNVCPFCDKKFDNARQAGGHSTSCKMNPDKQTTCKKLSEKGKGKKHTEATKQKISTIRKQYLDENPDKVPYILNHSSKMSYPEQKFKDTLDRFGISGYTYNMQVKRFAIDFAFMNQMLAIEIDGSTHKLDKVKAIDEEKTMVLQSMGWKIIRFDAKDVRMKVLECVDQICVELNTDRIPMDEIEKNRRYYQEKQWKKKYEKKAKVDSKQNTKNNHRKTLIESSSIDFSKYGWVNQVANLFGCLPQKVNVWMNKHMPDFYEEKCFKRKTNGSVAQW